MFESSQMASLNIKRHRVYKKRRQQRCGEPIALHVSTSENESELEQCLTDEEIEESCHGDMTDNSSICSDSFESDIEKVSEAGSASGAQVTAQVCASAEITTPVHTSTEPATPVHTSTPIAKPVCTSAVSFSAMVAFLASGMTYSKYSCTLKSFLSIQAFSYQPFLDMTSNKNISKK